MSELVESMLVGSRSPLAAKDIQNRMKAIKRQTKKIWSKEAKLGENSRLLSSAETSLRELNSYATPKDDETANDFRELLFRAWYNVWRARDYTIERFEREWSKPDHYDQKRENYLKLLRNGCVNYRDARFSQLHLPPKDPETLETIHPNRSIRHFRSSRLDSQLFEGVTATDANTELSELIGKGHILKNGYVSANNIARFFGYEGCWLQSSQTNLDAVYLRSCIACSDVNLAGRINLEETYLFSGSRFEKNLNANGRIEVISENKALFDFYVAGSFHAPSYSGAQCIVLKPSNQVGCFRLNLNSTKKYQISKAKCDLDLNSVDNSGAEVELIESKGRSLIISGDRTKCLHIKDVDFEEVDIKIAVNETVVEDSCLGTNSGGNEVTFKGVSKSMILQRCVFQSNANFGGYSSSSTIHDFDSLNVLECIFQKDFLARQTNLSGYLNFKNNIVNGLADMSAEVLDANKCRISKADFEGTVFREDVDFSNRAFTGRTSFDLCVFERIPIFHGAELHQDTSFRATRYLWAQTFKAHSSPWRTFVEFKAKETNKIAKWMSGAKKRLWPEIGMFGRRNLRFYEKWRLQFSAMVYCWSVPNFKPHEWAEQNQFLGNKNHSLGRVERSFRTLRQAMEKHNASDQAAIFHVNEMRARHARIGDLSVPRSEKFFGGLYDFLADYGGSFLKPIGFYFGLLVAMSFIYWPWALALKKGVSFWTTLEMSFLMMVRPWFQLNPRFFSAEDQGSVKNAADLVELFLRETTIVFLLVSTIQSLLAAILIFLVLLAVRRKFQLS